MTEKRYIYANVGLSFEILDSWFGYTGDDEPTEREIEEYDYLVIGLAPDQDAADGICRRLNDQQDEINHLSNFGLHVILDKKNKEIEQLKSELSRYKEVNRLDIWKSSYSSEDALITELQNKCDKKQKHIVLLENKIHRMREQIKKLEGLYHYRGYTGGSGDIKKEYYRREKLLRAENDQLKEKNEQLKKQLNRLYNYFEDWYSEITSANDFSEIWDNVKEDEQWSDVE